MKNAFFIHCKFFCEKYKFTYLLCLLNLSSRVLTNDEYETLQYGLKHGVASKPKDNEIFAMAEDIYDQINRKSLCKENQISIQHLKNSLRAFTFNILDIDDKNVYSDVKKLKVI